MADIQPFRGFRYNTSLLSSTEQADVVAPPYDVIDSYEQIALYERHPYNIVRLILNQEQTEDSPENNRYTRARRHLMDWFARGVLQHDEAPRFYVHEQTFKMEDGRQVTRRGFLGRLRLAAYEENIVLPHERTLRGPKEDRLRLMKATECNLSPVFMLYEDTEHAVDQALNGAQNDAPVCEVETPDGITHRLWAVSDAAAHEKVTEFFAEQQVYIADGHHRYETALAYRDFRREVAEAGTVTEDAPFNFALTFLVNMHDPGLQVFPTHRVVHSVEDFKWQRFLEQLKEHPAFEVTELSPEMRYDLATLRAELKHAGESAPSFVFLAPGVQTPYLVTFSGEADSSLFDDETPKEVRELDVAVLHEAILDRLLGISKEAQEAKSNLTYLKQGAEAIETSRNSDFDMVVLMNPTPAEQVARVCQSGGKMPQKSTFFYPKILSGLVINPL